MRLVRASPAGVRLVFFICPPKTLLTSRCQYEHCIVPDRHHDTQMKKTKRTPAGEALTNLMLDLFRLSSRLLTVGDRLVAGLGLTSARWQILGAITYAERPQPVAWLARDLGGNRQNVQRIVNGPHKEGLVAFEVNPHHRRAQLVTLTEKGRRT